MESAAVMQHPSPSRQQRLDVSLNNLLESEVMLGDEDGASSCDDSEMHSALEDLSDLSSKFVDCTALSTRSSSITDSAQEAADVMNHPSLTQSMYYPRHNKEEAVPQVKATLPRSNSTLSNRTFQSPSSRSRLLSPRQAPSYADNTACSKSRLSSSPYATMRRSTSTTSTSTSTSSPLVRKPSITNGQRPAVPPKPAGLSPVPALTRQSSSLNKGRNPESPITVRRTSSVSSPAARSFIAAGKQVSAIRSTPPKRITDDRYATLGRRPKHGSPSVVPTSPSNSNNSPPTTSTSMDSSMLMKATADKFATLPRRKPVKDRPTLPKPTQTDSTNRSMETSFSGATLPRPRKLSSPSSSKSSSTAASPKPRTLIYMEKSAQTEMSQQDVRDGLEASLKLRSMSWQQHNNEEIRQLELSLQQSREESQLLQQELDEEREERQVVQKELERTTQRVAAMLDSMEGVEREFHSRGDSLMHLESNLQNSTQAVCALQQQLEAQDAALVAQRLELDRSLLAEKALVQQLQESESESREMMEFLQAEKLALMDAVRDSDTEVQSLKSQLEESGKQLEQKEEECTHLVRLAEQRRHELAALQADLKGAEGRTGSVLLAQGAQLSAAALALLKLHSRMDGLLQSLMQSHRLPPSELEALVFPNEAYKSQEISPQPTADVTSPPSPASTPAESPSNSSPAPEVQLQQQQHIQRLVGSTSLQDLSDAINLTRRRLAPEGREEPNPVVDEELRLAASLVDQIEEADHILSKLLRVLRRLILDKDSTMQQLSDDKEQLLASLSAQTNALQEAKEELNKLRLKGENDQVLEDEEEPFLPKKNGDPAMAELSAYYGPWNDLSSSPPVGWTKAVSQVLGTLPVDVVRDHPALQKLMEHLLATNDFDDDSHDPNANGSG